jgi:4-amino-4-deoxy-L-arabinose transferase-like glycosyltransferase
MTAHPITRHDWWALALVVLIAAVLRLGNPGITEFFHDEAMLSMLAQDMAAGKTFPTEGILSSVGIPNPPTSVYVMWLPYKFTDDPLVATLYVAALNVIGVGLLWLIAHRYLGNIAALTAGLVYAVNPWAVLYSRKIWAQDFLTPFLLAALLLGRYGFAEDGDPRRRKAAQIACLPIFLFALQIHFAVWVLLPLYCWLLWDGRKRTSWRTLAVSGVLSALVLLPYAVGLAQTLDQDPTRISDTFNRSAVSKGLSMSGDALLYLARLATGAGLETWVAPQQQSDLLARVPTPSAIWIALIGAAVLFGCIRLWRRYNRALAMLITLWILLPLIIFTPSWTPIYPHYFIASIPALALLMGIGIASAIMVVNQRLPSATHRHIAEAVGFAALGVVLITQGLWWHGLLRYLDMTNTPYGFTTPVHYLLDVRDQLARYEDVLIVSNGMQVLYDQEPARWSVMLRNTARCLRTVPGDGYAIFPTGRFIAAIAPNAPPNAVGNLYVTDHSKIFPVRPGDGQYSLNVFEQAPAWKGAPITEIAPRHFSNGVQLTGYHLDKERLYLEWRLPGPDPTADYQYFGHFLDATGTRLGQRDAVFLPGRHWCAGDRLITWTNIQLPEGTNTLRIGMYKLGTGRTKDQYFSADVLDMAGNPAGQWVDIALTTKEK